MSRLATAFLSLISAVALLPAAAWADSPSADAGGPYTVAAEATVGVSASGSENDCDSSMTYRWDLNGDGSYDTAFSSSPAATFSAVGLDGPTSVTITVLVTATGCDINTDTDTTTVTVNNVAPVITSTTIPSVGLEGQSLSFSVGWTDVESADTHTVGWTFGDSTTATGASVSHAYADNGSYLVTVTVTDDDGGSATTSSSVTVSNVNPSITSLVVPSTGNEGSLLSFSCGATDVAADPLSYSWAFGDAATANGASATHVYADNGSFTVTCTVTDGDGGSTSQSGVVAVANVAPVATASGPGSATEGASASFSCGVTDAGPADTHSFAWSFGDSSGASGASTSHTWVDNGSYTVTCTATDDDGGSGSDSLVVLVANANPSITSMVVPASGDEGSLIAMSGAATDPGSDALSYAWDFGDGDVASGASVTHTWADSGTFFVQLTVTDDDGGTTSSTQAIVISNVPPVISSFGGDVSGAEGEFLDFAAIFSDVAADDTHTVTWDFGDSTTLVSTSGSATHAYADEGTYSVVVTVCDDDGGCDSSTLVVVVGNVAPTIVSSTFPPSADEGESVSFEASASDPGSADTLVYSWDFGDGDVATGASASHAWGDDGSFTVLLSVDDGTATTTATAVVPVANVAPEISGSPEALVDEGVAYSFEPAVVDPGFDDTHSWVAVQLPAGASIDPASGAVSWLPSWQDLGVHDLSIEVSDDDGDSDSLEWTVVVLLVDVDADGLSDLWEEEFGLDPADPADAALDPDGDGRPNSQEWDEGTDPQAFDGPGEPELLSPIAGQEWNEAVLVLSFGDGLSPTGEELLYRIELYEDSEVGALVWSAEGLAPDGGGTTAVAVDVELIENAGYTWRAAASDPFTVGSWTLPEAFVYNAVNEPPGVPLPWSPFDGSTIADLQPAFELGTTTDPDGDLLSYSALLLDTDGGVVATVGDLLPADEGLVRWEPGEVLVEGAEYCWFGWATDEHGLDGEESPDACFAVDSANLPPAAPEIIAPEDGSSVNVDRPEIVAVPGVDPEGRATREIFQLDTEPGYGSAGLQEAVIDSGADGATAWIPEIPLQEDALYYLRVATTDGAAVSPWTEVSFLVNTGNAAPPVPVLDGPADGSNLADGGALTLLNVDDPDGDEVRYDFVVRDETGEVVASVEGIEEDASGVTGWAPGAFEPGQYEWSARAVDRWGLASEWADAWGFVVLGDPVEPDVVAGSGCKCSSSDGAEGASTWLLLLGLGSLLLRRREVGGRTGASP